MIDTPIRKQPEVSPAITDALNHIEISSALEKLVTELKATYSVRGNLDQLTEINISGVGFKFTLSYNDELFEQIKKNIRDAVDQRIQSREGNISDLINGKKQSELKSEA